MNNLLGFYRTWDAQIVYLKEIDHVNETVTYVDVKNKEHTVPENQFFGTIEMLVGDIVLGPMFDQYEKYPFARKIEGFNFVRWSTSNDNVSLLIPSK